VCEKSPRAREGEKERTRERKKRKRKRARERKKIKEIRREGKKNGIKASMCDALSLDVHF